MKFKKKTAMFISFALGTTMFATTALAEVVSKNGYDQLKDSLKYTAENCTTKLSNYTMEVSFVVKDNGNTIFSESSVNKYDVSKQAMENTNSRFENSTKSEYYYYADKNCNINKDGKQNIYFITEYTSPREVHSFTNPFKEKQAGDVERIADALVGNLKDSVVVTQNADGSKQLSGSLSESQIPALVNAVVSLQSKNAFGNNSNNNNMPKITKDIFVKEVKGNMLVNKDGLIQSVLGTGVISGKDDNGTEHSLTFELLGKLSNINSTTVNKPDLSDKKVEKNLEQDYSKLSNPEKYIGKYKTDILIEKDGKFQKIGERFIDITEVTSSGISGRYYEEHTKGYEDYGTNKKDFKFEAKFEKDNATYGSFSSTSSSTDAIKGHISIEQHSAKIYFNMDEGRRGSLIFDDQFSRVFN
ncbi:hypothetical protein [Clostridium magnum]|uniref:Uncharacterized protein n=1 Tax=Clostridium magnum DSM 2767 TaxID=1121326 RepID=A0A161YGX9_9CLOT|nr:hypothetical protein [Clostridium magnum]KZL89452.1 hypothetical protein CLMAG_53560 [Clostridium magnum DSM 2767]SHI20262.1 hypothetical protein SAMN02745944_03163 [Clostridium magnum DSM 2767]